MESGAYSHSWDYIPGGLYRRLFNQLFKSSRLLKTEHSIARESGGSDGRPIENGRIKTTYERTKKKAPLSRCQTLPSAGRPLSRPHGGRNLNISNR